MQIRSQRFLSSSTDGNPRLPSQRSILFTGKCLRRLSLAPLFSSKNASILKSRIFKCKSDRFSIDQQRSGLEGIDATKDVGSSLNAFMRVFFSSILQGWLSPGQIFVLEGRPSHRSLYSNDTTRTWCFRVLLSLRCSYLFETSLRAQ